MEHTCEKNIKLYIDSIFIWMEEKNDDQNWYWTFPKLIEFDAWEIFCVAPNPIWQKSSVYDEFNQPTLVCLIHTPKITHEIS